jgi:hypothetical protein
MRRFKKWNIKVQEFMVRVLGFGSGFHGILASSLGSVPRRLPREAAGLEPFDEDECRGKVSLGKAEAVHGGGKDPDCSWT